MQATHDEHKKIDHKRFRELAMKVCAAYKRIGKPGGDADEPAPVFDELDQDDIQTARFAAELGAFQTEVLGAVADSTDAAPAADSAVCADPSAKEEAEVAAPVTTAA